MGRRLRPDVVTMDLMLRTMSGLVATEHIMAEHPKPLSWSSRRPNRQ